MAIVRDGSQIFCLRFKLSNSRKVLSISCTCCLEVYMDVNCGLKLLQQIWLILKECALGFCLKFIQSLSRMSTIIGNKLEQLEQLLYSCLCQRALSSIIYRHRQVHKNSYVDCTLNNNTLAKRILKH